MKTVTAKLANMRKPQEFVVYPIKPGEKTCTVQSDKAIGQFLIDTGEGVLNYKGSKSKYFMHLNPIMGAQPFTFPPDFVEAALAIGQGYKTMDANGAICLTELVG